MFSRRGGAIVISWWAREPMHLSIDYKSSFGFTLQFTSILRLDMRFLALVLLVVLLAFSAEALKKTPTPTTSFRWVSINEQQSTFFLLSRFLSNSFDALRDLLSTEYGSVRLRPVERLPTRCWMCFGGEMLSTSLWLHQPMYQIRGKQLMAKTSIEALRSFLSSIPMNRFYSNKNPIEFEHGEISRRLAHDEIPHLLNIRRENSVSVTIQCKKSRRYRISEWVSNSQVLYSFLASQTMILNNNLKLFAWCFQRFKTEIGPHAIFPLKVCGF